MTTLTTPARWTGVAARLGAAALVAGSVVLTLPGAAGAHVTVSPGAVEGGGFSVVSFRVPTERDDASTTEVRVTLPDDQPIGSVRTTPVPGWRTTVQTRTLDEPIDLHGQEVTEVVSTVTWRATGSGIGPGQFVDFDVSMGPLPESGELVFQALQTYSSGEEVDWNQVAVDDSAEPEHPAPVLRLTPPADEGDATPDAASESTGEPAGTGSSTASTVALAMSAAALLLSAAAVVLARRRRTT